MNKTGLELCAKDRYLPFEMLFSEQGWQRGTLAATLPLCYVQPGPFHLTQSLCLSQNHQVKTTLANS